MADENGVVLYTTEPCGFCRQAKTLLDTRGVDYRDPDGRRGRMKGELRVYGREHEPCRRCGTPIERIRAAGRGTWYCPYCQRLDADAGS